MEMKNKSQIALAIVTLAFGVVGCSYLKTSEPSNGPSNSSVANSAAEDSPVAGEPTMRFTPGSDAKADLEKIADRFKSVSSFRATMNGTGTRSFTSTADFAAPDRFQIMSELPDGKTIEMRIIGKETYMRSDGDWQKVPIDVGAQIANVRDLINKEQINKFKEIKYVGEETVDGAAAYLYEYKGSAPNGPAFTSKMWISKTSSLPVKMVADYETGDLQKMEVTYDYTVKISIEPPPSK